ncbi:MAG: methyl-accepting chemotaxis protein [Deltaproteobacteria bacterium]|nr:methyl-accepting chemotaxis protein [Deltaproteobacteria bacterium]
MKRSAFALSVIFFAVFLPSMCGSTSPSSILINDAAYRIESSLKKIDSDISKTAQTIGKDVGEPTAKRQALRDLCSGKTYAVDCVFINARGVMETIEPEKYRRYEGTNIKEQELVRRIHKDQKPVFSQIFVSAEGLQGIVFEYPVFDTKKRFAGSVSLFVMPEVLVREALKDLKIGAGTGIEVVEPSGTNVYSTEPEQNRLNVLTSPQYKGFNQLHDLVRRIIAEKEGTGTYHYTKPGTDIVVKKSAIWKNISFYDSYWRVVITTEGHKP